MCNANVKFQITIRTISRRHSPFPDMFKSFNVFREFKKTTTAMAMATSLNKRFHEEDKGCEGVIIFLIHLFAVLCKTMTRDDQIFRCLANVNQEGYFLNFFRIYRCVLDLVS